MTQESKFTADLIVQTSAAISEGSKRLLFWGCNPVCFELLAKLKELGISNALIVGIVDNRAEVWGQTIHGLEVLSPERIQEIEFDTFIVTVDRDKELALRELVNVDGGTPRIVLAGLAHLEFNDPDFDELAQSCLVKSYATGYAYSLIHLYQAIRHISAQNLRGDVAEFGICKGGTVVFIRKALQKFGLTESAVYGFDIFDKFPKKKSALDLYRHPKCEFKDYDTVVNYCERFGVTVVKGDICDTYKVLEGKPLVLSFFDTDNYSPTRAALEICAKQTVSGGVLFFDHYTTETDYLYTIGERMAAKEVLAPDRFFNPHGTGLFIKA